MTLSRMSRPVVAILGLALVARTTSAQTSRATVTGTLTDSVRNRSIGAAQVQFAATTSVGQTFVATSDSSGRFRIENLPPGRYIAGFFHPSLDSLGIEELVREVEIEAGANTVRLATPSVRTLLRAACRLSDDELKTRGLVVGRVRTAGVATPVEHATVQVWWSELVDPPIRGLVRDRTIRTSTRADGWFAVCGVPGDVTLLAQASSTSDTSGVIPIRLTSGAIRYAAFALGASRRVAGDAQTGVDSVWRGAARLAGIIRDDHGQTIESAEVSVVGTGIVKRTAIGGRFAVDSLPAGTQLVEVRAIGFEPVQIPVDLVDDASNSVELTMPRRAVNLTPVEVRALAEHKILAQLEYRRTRGTTAGYFMQPEEIRRRPQDQSMARLIEGTPGVMVSCDYPHSCSVGMYRPSSHVSQNGREVCIPALYIDGRRDRSDDFNQLDARHIVAVEVYPREIGRPVEFMDPHRNCGAVVFWTRRQ